jgi:hypothetical protein
VAKIDFLAKLGTDTAQARSHQFNNTQPLAWVQLRDPWSVCSSDQRHAAPAVGWPKKRLRELR